MGFWRDAYWKKNETVGKVYGLEEARNSTMSQYINYYILEHNKGRNWPKPQKKTVVWAADPQMAGEGVSC